MPKYQIEYNHGEGSKSFAYFDAEKDIEKAACEKANERLERDRESHVHSFGGRFGGLVFKPNRTLNVREWDMDKKCVKRGGHKFKLHLFFCEAVFTSGRKERNEWYEYNG